MQKSAKWKKLGSLLGAIGHRYEKNGIYNLGPRDLRLKYWFWNRKDILKGTDFVLLAGH